MSPLFPLILTMSVGFVVALMLIGLAYWRIERLKAPRRFVGDFVGKGFWVDRTAVPSISPCVSLHILTDKSIGGPQMSKIVY